MSSKQKTAYEMFSLRRLVCEKDERTMLRVSFCGFLVPNVEVCSLDGRTRGEEAV